MMATPQGSAAPLVVDVAQAALDAPVAMTVLWHRPFQRLGFADCPLFDRRVVIPALQPGDDAPACFLSNRGERLLALFPGDEILARTQAGDNGPEVLEILGYRALSDQQPILRTGWLKSYTPRSARTGGFGHVAYDIGQTAFLHIDVLRRCDIDEVALRPGVSIKFVACLDKNGRYRIASAALTGQ